MTITSNKKCAICDNTDVNILVDFGDQVVSNKFLKEPFSNTTVAGTYGLYKLSLGQCRRCSLIQLTDKMPLDVLKPEYDWITYMEPEAHLDNTVDEILNLGGLDANSRILGISFKDTSTLDRFKKKGYDTTLLDLSEYLDLESGKPENVGIESIQKDLPGIIKNVAADIGKFNLIIARHIVEHSYDLDTFLNNLKQLLTDDGRIMFEVPDFEKSLNNLDYPSIWEEHTLYFTESTLKATFDIYNMDTVFFKNYDYPMENSLVIVVNNSDVNKSEKFVDDEVIEKIISKYGPDVNSKIELGQRFGESFEVVKKRIKSFLKYLSNDNSGNSSSENFSIGMVGAGHLGAAFLNYFEVKDNFKYVIDDNSNKNGLYMPGTDIKIVPSSTIKDDSSLKILLLSINPRNEQKFLDNNKDFVDRGGNFYSIFLNSQNPMPAYYDLDSLNLKKYNDEVYYPKDGTQIVKYTRKHIDFLKSNVGLTVNKRIRICGHMSSQDTLHEMIILLDPKGYVRPHKHGTKVESFHIIEGALDIALFNNDGTIMEIVNLNAKEGNVFYRLNADIFHTVLVRGNYAIIHETTNGPFRKEDTVFAEWSPLDLKDDSSLEIIREYLGKIKNLINNN